MTETPKQLIGKNIRKYRKEKGLKQSELAELVGVEDKTISRIEVGGNYPSLDLLVKIAQVLEHDLTDFVNFNDIPTKIKSKLTDTEIRVLKKLIKILNNSL